MIVLSITVSPWWLLPIGVYALLIFISSLISTRSVKVAAISIAASAIQVIGYGSGFIRAFFKSVVLRRGRDINAEIKARKGK